MKRRAGTYVRPLFFLVGAAAFIAGVLRGLAWSWDWSLQTGNVFLTLSIPTNLVAFDPAHLVFLIIGVVGLALLLISPVSKERALKSVGRRSLLGPGGRFFPLVLVFALFCTYFGVAFLMNPSIGGDVAPTGPVVFVYLNYDGILARPFGSILGAIVLLIGLVSLKLSFSFGLGDLRDEDEWQPVKPERVRPVPAAEARRTAPASPPARRAVASPRPMQSTPARPR